MINDRLIQLKSIDFMTIVTTCQLPNIIISHIFYGFIVTSN
jgi:hypothetical protein